MSVHRSSVGVSLLRDGRKPGHRVSSSLPTRAGTGLSGATEARTQSASARYSTICCAATATSCHGARRDCSCIRSRIAAVESIILNSGRGVVPLISIRSTKLILIHRSCPFTGWQPARGAQRCSGERLQLKPPLRSMQAHSWLRWLLGQIPWIIFDQHLCGPAGCGSAGHRILQSPNHQSLSSVCHRESARQTFM